MFPSPSSRVLALALVLLVALPAGFATPGEAAPSTRWVVTFHERVPVDVHADAAYGPARVLRVDAAGAFAVVTTTDEDAFRAHARQDARVLTVERDARVDVAFTPNDPYFGSSQYGPQQIGAPAAWEPSLGSATVRVCIVDSGIRYTHEDLEGSRWLGGYDYVNGDADPWDDNGHGTFVTGIAAATTDNGLGMAGIAQAGILNVKSMDSSGTGWSSDIASGIRWCTTNGAHVTSLSLGGTTNSSSIYGAVRDAWDAGVLLVASSGNDGCNDCVKFPARHGQVIAVGCTTSSKARCSFSNGGPELELAAPGKDVVSTWASGNGAYRTASGTSASAPHVAGAAALVWAGASNLTHAEVRHRLTSNAEDLGDAGRDHAFGHGLVRVDRALEYENVAPVITNVSCAPEPGPKRSVHACTFSVSDDSRGVALDVSWGDGSRERWPASGFLTAGDFEVTHAWAASGSFNVSATATDNDAVDPLTSAPANVTHVIRPNEAPVLESFTCTHSRVVVGNVVTCTVDASDDGPGIAAEFDWGDGNVTRAPATGWVAPPDTLTATHAFETTGSFTVRAVVHDDDPDAPLTDGPAEWAVTVDAHAPPRLSVTCTPLTVTVRDEVTCKMYARDDSDGVDYEVDWGDGATTRVPSTGTVSPGTTVTAAHRYSATESFEVRVNVTDTGTPRFSDVQVLDVTVTENAAPRITTAACAFTDVDVGEPMACSVDATDDSQGIALSVDWGDGNATRAPDEGLASPSESFSLEHVWTQPGTFEVTFTVSDSADPPVTSSRTVTVHARPCGEERTGTLRIGLLGIILVGQSATRETGLSRVCAGEPFNLTAENPEHDFNVCWYGSGVKLRCDETEGPESGRVPEGTDAAEIRLFSGQDATYVLNITASAETPPEPEPEDPDVVVLAHDDGERDHYVALNNDDDSLEKRFTLPSDHHSRDAIVRLLVLGKSDHCSGSARDTHSVTLNGRTVTRLDACAVAPVGTYEWFALDVPADVIAGDEDLKFTIETVSPHDYLTRNLRVGVDQDADGTHSRNVENYDTVPGEAMVRLEITYR